MLIIGKSNLFNWAVLIKLKVLRLNTLIMYTFGALFILIPILFFELSRESLNYFKDLILFEISEWLHNTANELRVV